MEHLKPTMQRAMATTDNPLAAVPYGPRPWQGIPVAPPPTVPEWRGGSGQDLRRRVLFCIQCTRGSKQRGIALTDGLVQELVNVRGRGAPCQGGGHTN